MKKEDFRIVEYINYITNENREYKKGLFHVWKKNVDNDGSEHYIGLIEDLDTGRIVEADYNGIRFLTSKEVLDLVPQKGIKEL